MSGNSPDLFELPSVDGNWGEWSQWTNCDVSCAGGRRSRQRACTNPKPMYGGIDCSGDAHQEEKCATYPCPIIDRFGLNQVKFFQQHCVLSVIIY
ncbi:hypothetical protein KUTeg_001864 [Tegillarca granosa]|uniref:Uncharacterized protein n=1 Tax=Tegillarca granosa TaxID=220873 RepID=A0ABQ9FWB5_TEGGR|nr:hypothetical protein KUTeg_001864 [Tegillarca granosa]